MATELTPGALARILDRVAQRGIQQTAPAMRAVGDAVVSEAQQNAHVVTGRLRGGMTASSPQKTGDGWTVGVGVNGVPYAKYHPRIFRKATTSVKPRVSGLVKPLYKSWQ